MGYCKIISGGEDGRYSIELDFGKAQKDAILAALTTAINKNDLDILQAENELAEAAAEESALFLVIQDLIDQYALITRGAWEGSTEEAFEITQTLPKKQAELAKLKVQNEPLRYTLRQLKFVRASLRKQAQQFNLFQPIQSRQAWCTDLTENRAAGSYVGTIEVKGEPDLVLIQPGARAWTQTDGIVRGREVMSPWQAYWNAAVLPGWQKWKPTYRWGTLTAINYDDHTCSVSLAAATSSAQRLDVNQGATLTGVPISYMTCNSLAFKVDDRVIVRFNSQDWSAPMVIGFLDNPKPCIDWPRVRISCEYWVVQTAARAPAPDDWIQYLYHVTHNVELRSQYCGLSYFGFGAFQETKAEFRHELRLGAAQFVGSPPPEFVLDSDIPEDTILGTSIGGTSGSTPRGMSATWLRLDTTSEGRIFRKWEATFATGTFNQYTIDYLEPPAEPVLCVIDSTFAGKYNPSQAPSTPFWDFDNGGWTYTQVYGPGPLHGMLAEMPTVSVTYEGDTVEYVYSHSEYLNDFGVYMIFKHPEG